MTALVCKIITRLRSKFSALTFDIYNIYQIRESSFGSECFWLKKENAFIVKDSTSELRKDFLKNVAEIEN